MHKAYVRSYIRKTERERERVYKPRKSEPESNRLFIFDTETTIDEKQNLKVGFFIVIDKRNNRLLEQGCFYKEKYCSPEEEKIVKQWCERKGIPLYTHEDFVDKKFYPYVYLRKACCIGFNLPFDISR